MALNDDVRILHGILIDFCGVDNADTLMDYLNVPDDWRRLIVWHSGTRPNVPEEVRLRRLYVALVERMGGEVTDIFMEILGVRGEWRLCDPSEVPSAS